VKHDKLFSTHVYLLDNVLNERFLLDIRKDIISSYNPKIKNWQSKADLHRQPLDCYFQLADKVLNIADDIMNDLKLKYEGLVITDMWATVLKPGETHRPHTHSNNVLSGVFYVDADAASSIIFTDPRPQAGVLQPDVKEQFVDNASLIKYDSATNRMILFPAWLQHYVPINETKYPRISIAFNVMLKGKVGSSEEYQSAEF
jgi:uncharacterized protein (TIGR02466 family)